MEPSGSLNISQILFKLDEKTSESGTKEAITKAYLNQSKLSTYYQDNPYQVLSFVNQFNMSAPGGKISNNQGSGARPQNTFVNYQKAHGEVRQPTAEPMPQESQKMFNFYSYI